jgi:signal transduction histidine kinase
VTGTAGGGRWRAGIGGRLFAAFAAVGIATVAAGVVGWAVSRSVETSLRAVAGTALPSIAAAEALSSSANALAAAASALAKARTSDERSAARAAIQPLSDRLRAARVELSSLGFAPAETQRAGRLIDRLDAGIQRADALVRERVALTRDAGRRIEAVGRSHAAFLAALSPLVDEAERTAVRAANDLVALVGDAGRDADAAAAAQAGVAQLMHLGFGELSALRDLAAEMNLAVGVLNEAARVGDPARLLTLETMFRDASHRLGGIRIEIRPSAENEAALRLVGAALLEGLGPDGLFRLQERLIGLERETADVVAANVGTAAALGEVSARLVAEARRLADARTADARSAAEAARWALVAIAAAALALAVAVGHAYVGRGVVDRIAALRRAMEAQADGRPVPIPAGGGDEIADMADALRRFVAERERAAAALEAQTRRAEEARRAAEEANHAKSAFLTMMSHELRTPLNAIIGFAELLRMPRPDGGPPRTAEYAGYVLRSAEHLLSLITDLLDLSRIEAGRMELRPERVDIGRLAEDTVRMMGDLARRREVALAFDAPPGEICIVGDARAVLQVLHNIVGNALKYTPSGGSVRVSLDADDDHAVIRVSDTGVGMTPDELRIALEPFGRNRGDPHVAEEGTGLGLPLVQGLMDLHGGLMEIDSVKGRGTAVALIFPRRGAAAAPGTARAAERDAAQ